MVNKVTMNKVVTLLLATFMFLTFIPIFSVKFACIIMALTIVICFAFYNLQELLVFIELLSFIVILFLYYLFEKGLSFSLNGIIYYTLSLISAYCSFILIQKISKKQIRFLIYLLAILVIYSNISTIYISAIDPMAVRKFGYYEVIGGGVDFLNSTRRLGFVMYSYGTGEALAFLIPAMFSYSFNNNDKFIKVLCILGALLGFFSQLMSSLSASFILSIVFSGFTILSFLRTKQFSKKLKILLIVVIFMIMCLPFLMNALANSALLRNRLFSIRILFIDKVATGDINERLMLYEQSIIEWLKNPILGFAEVGNVGYSGVSMHTALFDYLGLYGVFSLLFFNSWSLISKKLLRYLSLEKRKYYKWGNISLILLLILKGPVFITTNFYFSIVLLGLLIVGNSSNYHMVDNLNKIRSNGGVQL